jgi:hypothetical protein
VNSWARNQTACSGLFRLWDCYKVSVFGPKSYSKNQQDIEQTFFNLPTSTLTSDSQNFLTWWTYSHHSLNSLTNSLTVIPPLNDRTRVDTKNKILRNYVYQYFTQLLTLLSRSKRYESSSLWSASQSEMISPIYLKVMKLYVGTWKHSNFQTLPYNLTSNFELYHNTYQLHSILLPLHIHSHQGAFCQKQLKKIQSWFQWITQISSKREVYIWKE